MATPSSALAAPPSTTTPATSASTTTTKDVLPTPSPAGVTAPSTSTTTKLTTSSPAVAPSSNGATTNKPPALSLTIPPTPATRQAPQPAKLKKKKRKGLAGFFAALGCGGGNELEDAPKEKAGRLEKPKPSTSSTAAKPSTSTGEASGSKPVVAAGVGGEKKDPKSSESGVIPSSSKPTAASTAAGAGAGIVLGAATAVVAGKTLGGKEDKENVPPTTTGGVAKDEELEMMVAPEVPKELGSFEETEGLTSAAVQPPGSGSHLLRPATPQPSPHTTPTKDPAGANTHSSLTSGTTEISDDSFLTDTGGDGEGGLGAAGGTFGGEEEEMDEEDRLIMQGGIGIPTDANGNPAPLLPPMSAEHTGRKCLVLDLDETLLHSSFKMISSADYIVPVEIESQTHNVYVIKRPGVDNFLRKMGEIYEVVVFTASLSKYADPVLDMLDVHRVVKHRLFRESCYNHKGNYVKDLSQLGRDMHSCIIIDNSPASYIFHQNNAVPVSTWFNDPHDTELTDLCPFLTDLETVDDIRGVLDGSSV